MSFLNETTKELEQWIAKQIRQGVQKEQLYFYLLKRGFSAALTSAMLHHYTPIPRTAIIEQFPDADPAPAKKYLSSAPHFYAWAHIRITKERTQQQFKSNDIQLFSINEVLPQKLCEQLIIRAKRFFSPSKVVGQKYQQAPIGRTSSTALVRDIAPDADRKIQMAIGELMGIDNKYCEPLQIQRYEAGEEYQRHSDWFDKESPGFAESIGDQGQRTWTCLLYLNDDFTGGQTEFTSIKQKITPKTGKACVWNNLLQTGDVNNNTWHRGMPVKKGIKYILTAWFRARPSS